MPYENFLFFNFIHLKVEDLGRKREHYNISTVHILVYIYVFSDNVNRIEKECDLSKLKTKCT